MFDQSFSYRYINHHPSTSNGIPTICHNYSFKGNKKRYIVIAEQFHYEVYAIKFYLQEHKFCEHRFTRLSAQFECTRVISTIGNIILEIHNKYPYSSFVFVGSPLESETQKNTKRFKLYSKVVENFVSPLSFEHRTARNYSAYLMMNRNNQEQDLLFKIEQMFKPIYEYEFTDPSNNQLR